jgi:SAM-dependent methyltransferase
VLIADTQLPTTTQLFLRGLRDEAREHGWLRAVSLLIARLAGVLRDSFPDRRRMRFGDIQYDLDHRVNTTWSNVAFGTRLREAFINAEYQTTDPLIFAEAMQMLASAMVPHPREARVEGDPTDSNHSEKISERESAAHSFDCGTQNAEPGTFVFIDLGSGKGRVLLMAAEYPFRRIIGVELLPELHEIARQNLLRVSPPSQALISGESEIQELRVPHPSPTPFGGEGGIRNERIELVLGDVRSFTFPPEPLVVFLFNPFPAHVIRAVMQNLQRSLESSPRPAFVIFHNAVYEAELAQLTCLKKAGGTHQFVIYQFSPLTDYR